MIRKLATALLAAAALAGATAAQAGTHWSIGINLPVAGMVVSDGRYVEPAPVYYAPAPVYYAPAPVYYAPAPRYVEREVYYTPPLRVIYETPNRERRWDDRRWEHERHEQHARHERWEDRRDDYGPRHGR